MFFDLKGILQNFKFENLIFDVTNKAQKEILINIHFIDSEFIVWWFDPMISLLDSASKFVCNNQGKLNENGAYKEMFEKDAKLIACVFSKMFINVPDLVE